MKLWSLIGNSQKLDGGAMFGNVPRAMWAKWSPPDDENRIELACRALLASPLNGKTVLFEAGIGAFFEPKLRERYGVVEERHVLFDSLAAAGFKPEDIDVVVLSHLHFDHKAAPEILSPGAPTPTSSPASGVTVWKPAARKPSAMTCLQVATGTGRTNRAMTVRVSGAGRGKARK